MRMLLTDTQMDRLEARFGANYQAPDRKLNRYRFCSRAKPCRYVFD
mgnify:CR=1 FL=1